MSVTTTVRLQTDIEKQLDTLSTKLKRSKGWVIKLQQTGVSKKFMQTRKADAKKPQR